MVHVAYGMGRGLAPAPIYHLQHATVARAK